MADENTKEYKLVTDKLEEMKPLFDRMDEDEDLYLLEPYEMYKLAPNDKKKEKDVANVTLNDPLLYAKKAIAIVGSYERTAVIEGRNLSDRQTTKLEDFVQRDMFYMVDEFLQKRGIPSLDAFINEQACVRGGIPARCCIQLNGEELIPDIVPVDRRWFPYDVSDTGLAWAAPITKRAKSQIEREYPDANIPLKITGNEVVDFWDSERELIFVEKHVVKEQPNPYGYVPFVHAIAPIGCMLTSDDALEHEGESIFWPNRDLWKEKNETTTILKTLSRKALKGGLEIQRSPNSPDWNKPPGDSPFQEDVVIQTETGGGFKQLPVNDIRSATRLLYSILETCLQRGELTPLDYGTLTFPLSSVAIMNLMAARNDIFAPVLSMIASFYQSLSRMIINQCRSFGKIKIGRPGGYNTYNASDFEGEFTINYHFSLLTKEGSAADAALARTLKGVVSDDYIRRNIFKVQNPDGMKFEIESEEAERVDEVLFLYRRAASLIKMSNEKTEPEKTQMQIEASILADRIETILRQRRAMGQLSPIEGKREEPKAEEMIPLFGGGGGGAKPRQEAEVEQD